MMEFRHTAASTGAVIQLHEPPNRHGITSRPVERPTVCVQGLGFVGCAMAVAVADAQEVDGTPRFDVVGVDLPTPEGAAKIEAVNAGRLPFATSDPKLGAALAAARERGNLRATSDERVYDRAAVTIVDVPLDVARTAEGPAVDLSGFCGAIRTLGRRMPPGSLVVVETTVPPGTCERVVVPELTAALAERELSSDALLVAHSYERVMPGDGYFDSIVNFWRNYAGHTEEAADACERFLAQVVNVSDYPLVRLHSTTACELAKVLENSYRAATIALMEEWARFAEAVGVDLFAVISAIRRRPTHSNMRQPGFGVGGYCLTKDPLLGWVAARQLFGLETVDFPFSSLAVAVNERMPLATLDMLNRALGTLEGKRVLLMGVSYRQGVADTRHSPSETFVRELRESGATVVCHDPLVQSWPELGIEVACDLPSPDGIDAVVFAVQHPEYRQIDLTQWLDGTRPLVLDANAVLSDDQYRALDQLGCRVRSIGRG